MRARFGDAPCVRCAFRIGRPTGVSVRRLPCRTHHDTARCRGVTILTLPHFREASPNLITSGSNFPSSQIFRFVMILANCHIMSPLRP
ncbi:hypothetical protein Bcep18194_A3501 [Burkholderia lata]|uniref:Uncharacterized protein n=1 Tax=Burkholderia lata (strain ATCC 17760 / DSM 23089 / LMG 22485 / NCIMB 9086 / R18194 / 383) TaxID=482957 RepID=Q39KB3_BURL3|nr:hypothetical protein Bcep18194_A3501 [Burkholderia lata]